MIYRSNVTQNYTVVNNNFLRNKNLSWKAKGLLTYLISLPPDWKVTIEDLINRSKDNRDAVRTAMTELIGYGYCYYVKVKDQSGRWLQGEYYISDEPIFLEIVGDYPAEEKPTQEKPQEENPELLNTILNKYFKKQSTKEVQTSLFELTPVEKKEKKINGKPAPVDWENSGLTDLDSFKAVLTDDIFMNVNIEYYFKLISNWARSKSPKPKSHDWAAFSQNWILKELATKKAILKTELSKSYLKDGYE